MPGRTYAVGSAYRYGFNGKEQDSAVNGTGVDYDYGARIYDARVGRFLSVDPLARSYPWNCTYSYGEDDVIRNIDLDGLEKKSSNTLIDKYDQGTEIDLSSCKGIAKTVWNYVLKPSLKVERKLGEDAAAIAVRECAIRQDPEVLNYSETEKLQQFNSDANNSIAILFYEFSTGTGPATRYFAANTEFAKQFASGYVLDEVKENFYQKVNEENLTYDNLKDGKLLNTFLKNISFSPDNAGVTGAIQKHFEANSTQFFIASTDNVYIGDVAKDGTVSILIYNQTNEGSLLAHLDKLGLIKDKNRPANSNNNQQPLSTTYQWIEIKFKIDPSKLKNRSDFLKIKPEMSNSQKIDDTQIQKPHVN